MAESELCLAIGRGFIGDLEKGWCRLQPAAMDQLGVSSGDAVLVSDGNCQVGCYAHSVAEDPPEPHDGDEQVIQLAFGSLTGESPSETKGRKVTVRPVTLSPARSVVHQEFPPNIDGEEASDYLLGKLAIVGMNVWVTHSLSSTATYGTGLDVYETDPEGPVVITESTTLKAVPDR